MTGIGSELKVVADIIREFVCDAYEERVNPLPILRQVYPQVAFRFSSGVGHYDMPPTGSIFLEVTPSWKDPAACGADIVVLLHAGNTDRTLDGE